MQSGLDNTLSPERANLDRARPRALLEQINPAGKSARGRAQSKEALFDGRGMPEEAVWIVFESL